MSSRKSVAPYVKALFDVALSEGRAEAVGQEIATINALVADHPELRRLLSHPAVPPRTKREVIVQVATQAGVSPPVQKLVALIADRNRLGELPQLNDGYQAKLRRHQGVVEAHITTAEVLPPDRQAAIASGLAKATGKQVLLTASVDPEIIGGVRARLGSKVFDGSVLGRLERLRARLVSASQ